MPGNVTAHQWQGFVPYDSLPRSDEGGPAAGYVVSANNQVLRVLKFFVPAGGRVLSPAGPGVGSALPRPGVLCVLCVRRCRRPGRSVPGPSQVTPANYQLAPLLTHDWDAGSSGYRARRISTLLQEAVESGRKLTGETMRAIQLDTHSGLWEDVAVPVRCCPRLQLGTPACACWTELLPLN